MKIQFIPSTEQPVKPIEPAWWFIFSRYKLLMASPEGTPSIPLFPDLKTLGISPLEEIYLGILEGKPCYAAAVADLDKVETPPETAFLDLRLLYGRIDQELLYLCFRAIHLLDWSQKTRFCKRCGNGIGYSGAGESKKMSGLRASEFSPHLPSGHRFGGTG